jgi:hypothetical protein
MNILRLSTLSLAVTLGVLALAYANPSFAGKKCDQDPTHPSCGDDGGDPPPPPVESCAGASGVFPSFAYTTYIYDGKKGSQSGTNLHLANSDGSCSIIIYTQNDRERLVPNYRQIGNHGRIVWSQSGLGNEVLGRRHPDGGKAVVQMLDFSLDNGALDGEASLSTVYMYQGSNANGGGEPELSSDGSVVFFGQHERLENGEEPASLYSIDLSICTSLCSADLIIPPGAGGQADIAINRNGQRDRIYRTSSGGGFGITFIEATDTGYSDLRTVVLPEELGTSKITKISVGNWDHDMDGTAEEVIAIALNYVLNTIYIIDVSDCETADGSPQQSCLASGESTIVRTGIVGARPSFLGEDLLLGNGDNVEFLDTDSLDTTFLLQGDSPDSAE